LIPKILTIHLNSPFQPKYVISVCGWGAEAEAEAEVIVLFLFLFSLFSEQEERNEQDKFHKMLLKLQKPQLKELIRELVKADPRKLDQIQYYIETYERLELLSNTIMLVFLVFLV
jgi:hypothetical protein